MIPMPTCNKCNLSGPKTGGITWSPDKQQHLCQGDIPSAVLISLDVNGDYLINNPYGFKPTVYTLAQPAPDKGWALEWTDGKTIDFDHTVIFGESYDFEGMEWLAEETITALGKVVIWPDCLGGSKNWAYYFENDGGFKQGFASKQEIKSDIDRQHKDALTQKPDNAMVKRIEALKMPDVALSGRLGDYEDINRMNIKRIHNCAIDECLAVLKGDGSMEAMHRVSERLQVKISGQWVDVRKEGNRIMDYTFIKFSHTDGDNKLILEIKPNGEIILGEGISVSEASKVFYDYVCKHIKSPIGRLSDDEIDELKISYFQANMSSDELIDDIAKDYWLVRK